MTTERTDDVLASDENILSSQNQIYTTQDRFLTTQDREFSKPPESRIVPDAALSPAAEWSLRRTFTLSLAGISGALIATFVALVRYSGAHSDDAEVTRFYQWYLDVAIMVFVGFGFLMTFLRSYSYSAVGLNFCMSGMVVLAAIICVGAAEQEIWNGDYRISLDLPLLINSNFCAAAAMISFGAVIGKVTPTQLLWLMLLEVPLYAVNAKLAAEFKALDMGGSITIHIFGAYYGLAASWVLSKKGTGRKHVKNSAIITSDMTAMIGTLFLWLYWPSFNGALASDPASPLSHAQFYCAINTVLSLLGSCCSAIAVNTLCMGKFDMVLVQNATLAGGVGMGSAANLYLTPGGALAIGMVNGCVSSAGFSYLLPWLESRIKLRDTCGVHCLHGIPGILGGLAAGIAGLAHSNKGFLLRQPAWKQLLLQLASISVTLGIAITGGLVVAVLIKICLPRQRQLDVEEMYDDHVFWRS